MRKIILTPSGSLFDVFQIIISCIPSVKKDKMCKVSHKSLQKNHIVFSNTSLVTNNTFFIYTPLIITNNKLPTKRFLSQFFQERRSKNKVYQHLIFRF